ncbi:MAG: hypothetical protein WDW36_008653 [Sanguina aurantia]
MDMEVHSFLEQRYVLSPQKPAESLLSSPLLPPLDTTVQAASSLPTTPAEPTWAGYLELLTVSLLWGTYNPIMRTLYNEPDPLDAATLTALRTTISASGMFTASTISSLLNRNISSTNTTSSISSRSESSSFSSAAAGEWWSQALDTRRFTPATALSETRLSSLLTGTFLGVIPAGMELGVLNFVGTALQAQGLTQTSATRAGFLVMLTGVLTPVISYLAGVDIKPAVWGAVALGLAGSVLVAFDALPVAEPVVSATAAALATAATAAATAAGSALALAPAAAVVVSSGSGGGAGGGAAQTGGEGLLLCACVFFSLGTVRLGMYAPRMDSLQLALVKKLTLASASLSWAAWNQQAIHTAAASLTSAVALAALGTAATAADAASAGPAVAAAADAATAATAAAGAGAGWLPAQLLDRSASSWALIVYSSLGPGALATYLQAAGQAKVPATQAQVIYSLTPLWSALLAYLVLGDEGMGPVAYVGGATIVAAGLIAASSQGLGGESPKSSSQSSSQ